MIKYTDYNDLLELKKSGDLKGLNHIVYDFERDELFYTTDLNEVDYRNHYIIMSVPELNLENQENLINIVLEAKRARMRAEKEAIPTGE
ncbi:MAG: hypothetical protein FWF50_05895 [Defluviitaleaceae bacterium]|nr:hypothetical protein [Defluviitaleaceae bacterium]